MRQVMQKLTLKKIMKSGLKINAPYKKTKDTNYDTFGPHVLSQISDKKKQIIVFSERIDRGTF